MKIQFIPLVSTHNYTRPNQKINDVNKKQKPIIDYTYNPITYQDYNISFGARTPENFYEFNSKTMPYSMRNYLNYDREQRKHIPPEQMMHEVFKYIDINDVDAVKNRQHLYAKNFDDVKKLYPNEELFKNLHPLRKNPRKGILSEIKVARDLSDTPLLKNGSDDFGMYLLKKIYKEGKTLKEISKDFLEKDINDVYKGFITEQVDYSTTAAYGIKFPDNGFWHSFIATRDEYKKFFVTLPKNIVDPNRAEAITNSKNSSGSSNRSQIEDKDRVSKAPERKYNIQKYKKQQLKNDIKNAKGDIDTIEKAVRRRFSKNDPEASFIIKYLSPIMTVAADKVHLSEEMKYFFEFDAGTSNNLKLERFWKSNPVMLENYSTAITDTIELFEDAYEYGGLVPINSNYEQITSESLNQKAIDYVTPYFLDLLNHSLKIKPTRDKRYADYELEQQKWEEHFKERYGDIVKSDMLQVDKTTLSDSDVETAMNKAAAANPKAKFCEFILDDGTKISFVVDFEEVITQKLKSEFSNMPNNFITKYTKFFLNHPKADEKLLLSLACSGKEMSEWGNIVGNKTSTKEEMNDFNERITKAIKERLYSVEELYKIMNEIYCEFETKNPKFMTRVNHSIMEYSTRLSVPNADYLKEVIDQRYKLMNDSGLIPENMTNENKLATYASVYRQTLEGIESMKSHNITFLNTRSLEAGLAFLRIGNNIEDYATEMDKIMRKYNTPLTNSERNKISRLFMDIMINMNPYETESFKKSDLSGFYSACMETLKQKENAKLKKEIFNLILNEVVTPDNTTLRYLLDANADQNLRDAKVEFEVGKLMQTHMQTFKMLASLDDNIMDMYIKTTNPRLYIQLKSNK